MTEAPKAGKYGKKQRILISGASGMIGSALFRSWDSSQISPLRLVRSQKGGAGDVPGESILWDPAARQPFADPGKLEGVEVVVHLSGANVAGHRWTQKYKREIVSSRVQSTHALANALAQLDPLPQVLVCASAVGIFGDRGDELLTETSPPGTGFLAETCIAWEAATKPAFDAGIRVVHTRFGVVLSPKGGALAKMLPLFRLGLGGKLGDGRAWMPWVTLRDVVGILNFCIEDEAIHGPVNVVAPNATTNAEFTHALGSALHRPAILPAPAFALRLAFGEMADQALLASAHVLPSKLTQAGYCFSDPEIREALRHIVAES